MSLPAEAKLDFLSYKNSASPEPRLQFAQISLQQLLQLAWPLHNNGVSCDAQKLLVTKFCQGARQRFARCSHFGGKHALGPVEFNFNLRCAESFE